MSERQKGFFSGFVGGLAMAPLIARMFTATEDLLALVFSPWLSFIMFLYLLLFWFR